MRGARAQGCERSVITYSSLITACEKAGEWSLALKFFRDMPRDGCRPNVVTYNSLLSALSNGAPLCRIAGSARALFSLSMSLPQQQRPQGVVMWVSSSDGPCLLSQIALLSHSASAEPSLQGCSACQAELHA